MSENGFYEWTVIFRDSVENNPESAIPHPVYSKPAPPCKPRKLHRRRLEKGSQTDFKPAVLIPTVVSQPSPPPDNDNRLFVFILGIFIGMVFRTYIRKN